MKYLSPFPNLFASATLTCSAEDASYPASNLGRATRPDIPGKTTALGDQSFDADLGSAQAVVALAVLYANVTTVRWLADDAPTFNSGVGGAPQFSSGDLAVGLHAGNDRYCRFYQPPSPVTRRYWRLLIPSQTPVDGASVYRVGAAWAVGTGKLRSPQRGIQYLYKTKSDAPFDDLLTKSRRRQRIIRGPAFWTLSGERTALANFPIPFQGDELADWLELERLWWVQDAALYVHREDNPYMVSVMRQVERPEWTIDATTASATFRWEEVTGP